MQAAAVQTSIDLAEVKGPFEHFSKCKRDTLNVLKLHQTAADAEASADPFWSAQSALWAELVDRAEEVGVRNSQWTLIAPTGTIGLLMDCDTLGIEPEFSLMKTKSLAGGGVLSLVNQSVEPALKALGLSDSVIKSAVEHLKTQSSLDDFDGLTTEQKAVFTTAIPASPAGQMLSWQSHLNVMQAAQPFLSGAISKTVNLPESTQPEEISKIYREAHQRGLKSIAIYREGSKGSQPLNVKSLDGEIAKNQN